MPVNNAIYARYLLVHPRSQFKDESNYWSDQECQDLSNASSSDDEFPAVDLPFASGELADDCTLFFFPLFFSFNFFAMSEPPKYSISPKFEIFIHFFLLDSFEACSKEFIDGAAD